MAGSVVEKQPEILNRLNIIKDKLEVLDGKITSLKGALRDISVILPVQATDASPLDEVSSNVMGDLRFISDNIERKIEQVQQIENELDII
jgi:hypothetical protein